MRILAKLLFPMMLLVAENMQAKDTLGLLREHAIATFGDELLVSDEQLGQLAWVLDNPVRTPEMNRSESATTKAIIHPEVDRALSRLYCLQRLRSGSRNDFQAFIAPQVTGQATPLSFDSFKQLSGKIQTLDPYHYDYLAAATLLSSVTLSPAAVEKTKAIPNLKIPHDSVAFLSATAPYAGRIYPLAAMLSRKYNAGDHLLELAFLPDSHLRHMLYNEGTLAMYQTLTARLAKGSLSRGDLDFWYVYWAINIAGFQGHVSPKGSLYLTQPTFDAMTALKTVLDQTGTETTFNPMQAYLATRVKVLGLDQYSIEANHQLALASLASLLRLSTPEDSQHLFHSFKQLPEHEQQRWFAYTHYQLTDTRNPTPTYAPAVFANALKHLPLTDTLAVALPLFLDVMDKEQMLRAENKLCSQTAVSFRELAQQDLSAHHLQQAGAGQIAIHPVTGMVSVNISK